MPEITPVEQYLLDEGLIPSRDLPPDKAVKPHLYERLKDWCIRQKITTHRRGEAWRRNLDSPLTDRGEMMCVELKVVANSLQDLDAFIDYRHDRLLRVIDWLVREQAKPLAELLARERPDHIMPERWDARVENERSSLRNQFAPLEELLSRGGSAWRVDVDPAGLFERVTDAEISGLKQATSVGDDATDYLREGWAAAWGLNPDGEKAHDRAIKALEAMFRDVVAPKHPGAKLNDIANYLRDKPGNWTGRLQNALPASVRKGRSDHGVEIVESIARGVFAADCRHAGIEGYTTNDLDDGRDAITLAVALIAMQRRGFLRRIDEDQ